jgi:hypothetical protein
LGAGFVIGVGTTRVGFGGIIIGIGVGGILTGIGKETLIDH